MAYMGHQPISELQKIINTTKPIFFVGKQTKKLNSIQYNSSGTLLATASLDGSSAVWNIIENEKPLEKPVELTLLKGHVKELIQVAFDPLNDNRLATASSDGEIRIWDVKKSTCITTIQALVADKDNEQKITNMVWSQNGKYIAICSRDARDDFITHIDVSKMKVVKRTKFEFPVDHVLWTKDCRHFLIISGQNNGYMSQGNIEIYTISTGEKGDKFKLSNKIFSISGHTAPITSVDLSKDGTLMATGGSDSLLSIWDMNEMVCITTIDRFKKQLKSVAFSHDSRFLASASQDELFIEISDVYTGNQMCCITVLDPMVALKWSPTNYFLTFILLEKDRSEGRINGMNLKALENHK